MRNIYLHYSIIHYLWMIASYLSTSILSILKCTNNKIFNNLPKRKLIILQIMNMIIG